MDFSCPSIGELAWSSAHDAQEENKSLKLKFEGLRKAVIELEQRIESLEKRLDNLPK